MFPKTFWSKAVLTAVYLIQRLPTSVLDNKNSLKVLGKTKNNLDHLKIFECTYFVHIRRHDKFDKNALKTMFLITLINKKVINILIHANKKYISHNV
jgi:hypothetical protein